jgi:nitroimidazol reductase NimA-like FMN-containing flavoprotein (pyridoxamine 5'-phosphate oxidase superfamily)
MTNLSRIQRYTVVSGEEGKARIIAALRSSDVGRLALNDEKYPYIVPMNHVLYKDSLILHGAFTGKKMDLIRRNGNASYEADTPLEANIEKKLSCHLDYESVIVYGNIVVVDDREERREYLKAMMAEYGRPYNHGGEDKCSVFVLHFHHASARDGRFQPSENNKLYLYDFIKKE